VLKTDIATHVETFAFQASVKVLPPTIAQVEQILQQQLPKGYEVLQWAIVKAEPVEQTIWIEGSYILHP
jgi:hypothetical protein